MRPESIRFLLASKEILQSELAKELGVSEAAISQTISGRGSSGIQKAIADKLGLSVERVWQGEDPMLREDLELDQGLRLPAVTAAHAGGVSPPVIGSVPSKNPVAGPLLLV